MEKKSVLFMIDSLDGGGAEHVLVNILQNIDYNIFDITLFLYVKSGIYLKQIPNDVHVIYAFKGNSELKCKCINLLYRIYYFIFYKLCLLFPIYLMPLVGKRIGTYDCAISFCEGINSFILLNQHIAKSRILWLHIDMEMHKLPFSMQYFKRICNVVNKIVCVSKDVKNSILRIYPDISSNKFEIFYNPVMSNDIIHKADEECCIEKQGFTIVSIGRLAEQKRFDRLIQAAYGLYNDSINFRLYIIGMGPLYYVLKQEIEKLNLSEFVILLGYKENVYPWLKASDLYVMSSDYEGLPLVICEAMLLDKPIVATNITGTRELLEGGKYGMLVGTNVEELYAGMKEMLDDGELRSMYSKRLKANHTNFIFPIDIRNITDFLLANS